jgi:hypothetical protein
MFDLFKCLKLSQAGHVYKNFIAFNIASVLLFASYDAVTSTASTLNQTEGLGITSQFIIYGVQLITCIVFPQIFIETIGYKYTLLTAEVFYLAFYMANIYPRWATLIPSNQKIHNLEISNLTNFSSIIKLTASILAGIANALFWTNLGIYFTMISKRLAYLTGKTFEVLIFLIHVDICFFM